MGKYLGIRLSEDEHRRIRAAAFAQGISVNAFVQQAVMVAVKDSEKHSPQKAGPTDFLLVGARNGRPGYRQAGVDLAKWLKKTDRRELRELRQMFQTVDAEMLRREKLKPLFTWFHKHFPTLMDRIPYRRRMLFAEGFLDAIHT